MGKIRSNLGEEDGNTVIEAIIVVTMTVIFIYILLVLGFFFYQRSVLQAIADYTATSIARTHSYVHKDPVTGYIGSVNMKDRGFGQTLYWLTQWDDYRANEEMEGENLYKVYEQKLRLMAYTGEFNPSVEVKRSGIVMFQDEVTVTAEVNYFIPFTKIFGVADGLVRVKAASRAICADIMGQDTYYRTINSFIKGASELNITKIVKSAVNIVKNITSAAGDLTSAIVDSTIPEVDDEP